MTLLRSKSIGQELIGRAHRIAGATAGNHPREAWSAARDYAGQAGTLAGDLIGSAGRSVRRHPRLGIAIGASLGIGAIAAAWLLSRRHARMHDEHDEHDPTRGHVVDGRPDFADGSGTDQPVPGESGLY